MNFTIITKDKNDSLELRLKTREKHLKYLNQNLLKLILAGPFLVDNKPVGSLIILEANNLQEVHAWLENEPYNKVNLFESIEIKEMKITIINP